MKLLSRVRLFETPWLLRPWNLPGKDTRVGCHFLLEELQKAREGPDSSGIPQMRFASRHRCVLYPQSPGETTAPLGRVASQCLRSRRRETLFPCTRQAGGPRLTVSRKHPSIAKPSLQASCAMLVSWSPPRWMCQRAVRDASSLGASSAPQRWTHRCPLPRGSWADTCVSGSLAQLATSLNW